MEVKNLIQQFLLLLEQLGTCDRQVKNIIDASDNSASAADDANTNSMHCGDKEIL